ncbi:unnamed protein product [Sphenostylis stenocarpa]|uniref:Uncharacterized protein n=1 Tax=Sphenostylis stenocarpa TaxID=92480 RepID=A0AA86SAM5_9FABA|nr:unnamed protein product [Sphenostylis stenocarpa]
MDFFNELVADGSEFNKKDYLERGIVVIDFPSKDQICRGCAVASHEGEQKCSPLRVMQSAQEVGTWKCTTWEKLQRDLVKLQKSLLFNHYKAKRVEISHYIDHDEIND